MEQKKRHHYHLLKLADHIGSPKVPHVGFLCTTRLSSANQAGWLTSPDAIAH
jgi:hypothetical protein